MSLPSSDSEPQSHSPLEAEPVKTGSGSDERSKSESESRDESSDEGEIEQDGPPLPDEEAPPLPDEAPPQQSEQDDGWAPLWDESAQAFYFHNRFTGLSQWENPRIPDAVAALAPPGTEKPKPVRSAGGYDPAIHGDYDPNADYAKFQESTNDNGTPGDQAGDPGQVYAATGAFNRFTGRWQAAALTPENFNDESKSHRQMNAFFDVDAAMNSHDGKSLKAERSGKKLSRQEVKAFKDKRREKKEEKRRAWLRD